MAYHQPNPHQIYLDSMALVLSSKTLRLVRGKVTLGSQKAVAGTTLRTLLLLPLKLTLPVSNQVLSKRTL